MRPHSLSANPGSFLFRLSVTVAGLMAATAVPDTSRSSCQQLFFGSGCGSASTPARCLLCSGRSAAHNWSCTDDDLEALCNMAFADPLPAMPDLTKPPPLSWGLPPAFGHATKREFLMRPNLTNFNQGSWGVCPAKVFDFHARWMRAIEADPDRMYRPGLLGGASDPWYDALQIARQACGIVGLTVHTRPVSVDCAVSIPVHTGTTRGTTGATSSPRAA